MIAHNFPVARRSASTRSESQAAMREDLSVVIDASRHAGIANVTFVTEGRLP
jgi:hypothetical protein